MFSQKLFRLINKIALFAIVFASLAPSISHAFAAQSGASFAQEVCTSNGQKITIQVTTTKGQQIAAEFSVNKSSESAPINVGMHLEHCPFCANPSAVAAIQAPHAPIIAILESQAQHISATLQVVLPRFSVLPPPAQAPPAL